MRTGALIAIVVVAIIIVAAAAWLGLGFALARGGGPMTTEDRNISEFSTVEVSGAATLVITQGDAPALRVEAERNVLDRLQTDVDGDTLRLRERWGWLGLGALWGRDDVTYYLTAPALDAIDISGSVAVQGSDPLAGDELVIECSGSTDLDLNVEVGTLRVHTSGSSNVDLRGSADSVQFDTSGSTNVAARGLATRTAEIDCSGSSDIEVNVSQSLRVRASGSSSVAYVGDPALDTDISGSGTVQRLTE